MTTHSLAEFIHLLSATAAAQRNHNSTPGRVYSLAQRNSSSTEESQLTSWQSLFTCSGQQQQHRGITTHILAEFVHLLSATAAAQRNHNSQAGRVCALAQRNSSSTEKSQLTGWQSLCT